MDASRKHLDARCSGNAGQKGARAIACVVNRDPLISESSNLLPKFSVVAVNEKGHAGEAIRAAHDREVYREFLARLPPRSVIAVEDSGPYSWLVEEMEYWATAPSCAIHWRPSNRMGLTEKKDKLDAKGVAILLCNVTIPEVWIPRPSITSVMVDISLCIVGSSQAC
jgi:hypothetical protein